MRLRLIAAVCALALVSSSSVAAPLLWKDRAELTSQDFRAIQAAFPYLKRQRPDWFQYKIQVGETEKAIVVSFVRPEDQSEGHIVNPDGSDAAPGFVIRRDVTSLHVYLDKRTFKKIKVTNGND